LSTGSSGRCWPRPASLGRREQRLGTERKAEF
jgi:hypothetical protein